MANSQLEFRTTLSPSLADNLLVYRGTPENPENAGTYSVIELKSFLDIELNNHKLDNSNPHNVSKEQIGLGNVKNTDFTQDILDIKNKDTLQDTNCTKIKRSKQNSYGRTIIS